MRFNGKFSQDLEFSKEIFLFRRLVLEILRKWQESPFFFNFLTSDLFIYELKNPFVVEL